MFNETQAEFEKRKDPVHMEVWRAYIDSVVQAGIMVSGAGLEPPHTATTLRIRDGRQDVQDGLFAETKEMLGGFIIIDVPDLDAALKWASRSPAATGGSVEIRPKMPERE